MTMNISVKSPKAAFIIGRCSEIVIGIVFIAGALPKAMDINRFAVQMSAYQVITDKDLLPWFALATLFAEMALGAALLLGLRLRGLTVIALEVMLVVFSGLIVYAWAFHGLEDCGCFPLVKMTPPVSLAKNVALFIWGLVIWRTLIHAPQGKGTWRGVVVRLILSLIVGIAAVGYAQPRIERIARLEPGGDVNTEAKGIDYSQFIVASEFGYFDLGDGDYLVPILSMSCDECMGKVPTLNELMLTPGMPPVVALCYEDVPGDMDEFKAMTQPLFPLHNLGEQPLLYFNLRGDDPFRMTLVRNGRAVAHWDGEIPQQEEIMAALSDATIPE